MPIARTSVRFAPEADIESGRDVFAPNPSQIMAIVRADDAYGIVRLAKET